MADSLAIAFHAVREHYSEDVEGITADKGLLMRLISLEFEDRIAGWKLCKFEFFNDITLLVGLSGVGKTRILDTLERLKAVAQGKTSQKLFGVQWSLVFEHDNSKYEWKGKMSEDPLGDDRGVQLPFLGDDDEDDNRPEFLEESLKCNDSLIAERKHEEIYFATKVTPKLSRRESVISLFKNEDLLKPAYSGMQMILSVDHSEDSRARNFFSFRNLELLRKKLVTVETIRATDNPTHVKLALIYENCREVFNDIVRQFQDAFPAVDGIEFKNVDAPHFGTIPRMFLYEQGVDKPIPEEAISSGMHRTLMHLSRMALLPDGTVVLIDEFENSFV